METNNIVTAPQIADVDSLFGFWKRTRLGNRTTFYRFMTTPSVERDSFINTCIFETSFNGAVAATSIRTHED